MYNVYNVYNVYYIFFSPILVCLKEIKIIVINYTVVELRRYIGARFIRF